jgi:hypothetical protein
MDILVTPLLSILQIKELERKLKEQEQNSESFLKLQVFEM